MPLTPEECLEENTKLKQEVEGLKREQEELLAELRKFHDLHSAGDIDAVLPQARMAGNNREIAVLVNETVASHVRNILKVLNVISECSEGNFSLTLEKLPGKQQLANEKVSLLQKNLENLMTDTDLLSRAATEGKLSTRADPARHQGGYKKIIEGVNATFDSLTAPLSMATTSIDRLSRGDIPDRITDHYPGDYNQVKDSINRLIEATIAVTEVARQLSMGNTGVHIEKRSKNDVMVESIQGVISNNKHDANNVQKMADGNLDVEINVMSDNDLMAKSCVILRDTLKALVSDANLLASSAIAGKLKTRADVTRHKGEYRKIVEGMNGTMDAVIGPLSITSRYIDQIGKGEIPKRITDHYNGDYGELISSINNCINGLQGLVECNDVLHRMSMNDHSVKVEGTYQGIYATMAASTNDVRDRLRVVTKQINEISLGNTQDLADLKRVGKRSEEDHILPAIINCLETIDLLIADTALLTKASKDGNLTIRADVSRHKGEYRKIVEGMNMTMDLVMEPVNEALRVSKEFAKTNFSARLDPSLKVSGDWIAFKDALNNIGIEVSRAFSLVNQQIIDLASSAEEANASIEEIASGSAQMAKNAAGVSSNAERGGENARQVMKAMEDLSSTVQDVATKTEAVSKLAIEANDLSKKGATLAKHADDGMDGITRNASDVERIVNEIKGQMDQIGKIVGLITDLANQTNLLALNAAIEAARAGDAGRGFAVVATEVKSLAQESRASAENIAEMIGALEKKTRDAALAASEAGKTVKEGSEALSETLDAFNMIVQAIEDITKNVEEVASASEEQAATVEEITASVTELTDAIQGTAREAVDAAAASEEASAAIDQIGKIIGNVNIIVDNVSKEVSKFKVG